MAFTTVGWTAVTLLSGFAALALVAVVVLGPRRPHWCASVSGILLLGLAPAALSHAGSAWLFVQFFRTMAASQDVMTATIAATCGEAWTLVRVGWAMAALVVGVGGGVGVLRARSAAPAAKGSPVFTWLLSLLPLAGLLGTGATGYEMRRCVGITQAVILDRGDARAQQAHDYLVRQGIPPSKGIEAVSSRIAWGVIFVVVGAAGTVVASLALAVLAWVTAWRGRAAVPHAVAAILLLAVFVVAASVALGFGAPPPF